MRTIIFTLLAFMSFESIKAQSEKMVVDAKGNLVGRYERTNATTYTVSIQDYFEVPIKGHRIVTYSAANGQGYIYRKDIRRGNINVRQSPSLQGAVIAKIVDDGDGYIPESYECLGKVNNWYKIRINGKVGYVRDDMVDWTGMDCR